MYNVPEHERKEEGIQIDDMSFKVQVLFVLCGVWGDEQCLFLYKELEEE